MIPIVLKFLLPFTWIGAEKGWVHSFLSFLQLKNLDNFQEIKLYISVVFMNFSRRILLEVPQRPDLIPVLLNFSLNDTCILSNVLKAFIIQVLDRSHSTFTVLYHSRIKLDKCFGLKKLSWLDSDWWLQTVSWWLLSVMKLCLITLNK